MKHTPGPWTIENPLECEMDSRPLILAQGGQTVVAEILQPLTDEEGTYRGTYDARLICAAPDLLRACQQILSADEVWMKDESSCYPDYLDHAIDVIRAAVAKATGKETP